MNAKNKSNAFTRDHELLILNSIVRSEFEDKGSAKKVLQSLKDEHFELELSRKILEILKNFVFGGCDVTAPAFVEALNDESAYDADGKSFDKLNADDVLEIFSYKSPLDAAYDFLVKKEDLLAKQFALKKLPLLKEAIDNNDTDLFWQVVNGMRSVAFSNIEQGTEDILTKCVTRSKKLRDEGVPSTGLGFMDEAIGGYHPRSIYTYFAHPGHGKTIMGLNSAAALSSVGMKVLYATSEMAPEDTWMRYIAQEASVSSFRFFNGKLSDMDYERILAMKGDIGNNLSIRQTRSLPEIYKEVVTHSPDILIIDHFHALTLPKHESRETATAMLMQGINDITVGENLTTIMLAQTRKESDRSKPPLIDSLYYSKEIEFWSFMCCSLFWPFQSDVENADQADFNFWIQKIRMGQRKKVDAQINTDSLKIYEKQINYGFSDE